LEELHERNKMLEKIANLKSAHVVEVNKRRSSFEVSSDAMLLDMKESNPQLSRDPKASGEVDDEDKFPSKASTYSKPSLFDDRSGYPDEESLSLVSKRMDDPSECGYSEMNSAYESFAPQKQLEPEESDGKVHKDDSSRVKDVAQDPFSQSDPRLIKVPGGEYFGQVNKCGQKHGQGKMIYGEKQFA
jgi:hypothetical protein